MEKMTMIDNDWELKAIVSMARDIKRRKDISDEVRQIAQDIIEDAEKGMRINYVRRRNMEEWFLRRPEYPDDWVGRPADDFDF
jgi:hypothetical protein